MNFGLRFSLVFAATVLLTIAAWGQVTTSTIYGTVSDPSGSAVPRAEVVLNNELTGTTSTTHSDENGSFTFSFVPVGRYTIAIRAGGFRERLETGLELAAARTLRLNYALDVGAQTEKITVTAENQLINTANAQQQLSLVSEQLSELPVPRRDWSLILTLSTGVTTEGNATQGVSLNGLASSGMRFTVDGTNASGSAEYQSLAMTGGNNNYIKGVSVEALQEVSVSKGVISAETANTISGGVNLITKSGTNEFHGSLFEANQNNGYSARPQFLTQKAPLVLNQFGGSFGGPILKNKLFFFGAYEGYRYSARSYFSGYVPTQSFRQTAIAAVPAYKQFLDLIPLPTSAGTRGPDAGFYEGLGSSTASDDHSDVRVDYYINDRNRVTARYTRGRPELVSPRLSPLNPRIFTYVAEIGTLNYTRTSAAWINEARFGYNLSDLRRLDKLLESGIPTLNTISGATWTVGGLGSGEDYRPVGSDMSFEDVLGTNRGRHSLKFGALYMRTRDTRSREELPNFSYASQADFLANIPNSFYFSAGEKPNLMMRSQVGAFVQDDMKVNSRLVVNAGIRYDYNQVPHERDDRFFNRGDPFGVGPLRPSSSIYSSDKTNVSPRLGFAWTIDRSAKTVLRGGTGMFYMPASLFAGVVDITRNAADIPQHLTFGRVEGLQYNLKYPLTNQQAYTSTNIKIDPVCCSSTVISTYFPNPYSMQWTMSVARQLAGSLALELAYVGNHAVHLLWKQDMNAVDRQTGLRPYPGLQEFEYLLAADSSRYNSLQVALRKRFARDFSVNAYYTWASSIAYGRGDLSNVASGTTNDRMLERGPVPYFNRHAFTSDFLYELPFARLMSSPGRMAKLALGGWQCAGIFTARTGLPIEQGIAQSSSLPLSRGDYIGGQPVLSDYRSTLQYLNPAAFARIPVVTVSGAPVRQGNINRSALFLPGVVNLDLSLSKNFNLTERSRFQIRADMFDSLNHTNYSSVDSSITSATFGRITGTRGARIVQMKARLTF